MGLYEYNKEEDIMIFRKKIYYKNVTITINPYIKIELNDSNMVSGVVIKNVSKILKIPKDQFSLYKIRCVIIGNPNQIELKIYSQLRNMKPKIFTIKRNVHIDIVGTEFLS